MDVVGGCVTCEKHPPAPPLATLPIVNQQGFPRFFIDSRADPTGHHMCPKARTGDPRDPRRRKRTFHKDLKVFRKPSGFRFTCAELLEPMLQNHQVL